MLVALAVAVLCAAAVPESAPPVGTQDTSETPQRKKKKKKKAAPAAHPAAQPATQANARPAADDAAPWWSPSLEGEALLAAGWMSGLGVYDLPAALTVVDVDATPALRLGIIELSAPASLKHRETWFVPLRETVGKLAFDVDVRPWRELRGSVQAGVGATSRPAWPDLLQPEPDAAPLVTDRFSHTNVWAAAKLNAIPLRHHHARLNYRFERTTSTRDPAFDPILRPNHLTPQDHDEHAVELSWRYLDGPLRLGLAAGGLRDEYGWVFARDAKTGQSHAGPGGDPPNPLLVLWAVDAEPQAEAELLRDDRLTVGVAWRVRGVLDEYAGYTSRLENRVTVDIESVLGPRGLSVALDARLSFTSRLYADTGYAAGPRHPVLDWGDRREARVGAASLSARFPARAPLHAFATVELDSSQTNFPDYEPGIYPTTQLYAVDRDYQRALTMAGVEMQLP